jgi:Tripartite ATP-independent periplasmic transporters, DctQ component.
MKTVVRVIAKVIVVIFSFGVLMGGIKLVNIQIRTGQVSAALSLPMSIPYGAMVVSFAIITLVQAVEAIAIIVNLLQNKTEEEKV